MKVDTLYEQFASGLLTRPWAAISALSALFSGKAAFKRRLAGLANIDVEHLPVREEFFGYLEEQAATGRELHLVSAADQTIVSRVAERFPFFHSAIGTEPGLNLKGINKAAYLAARFPGGFVYAGDSSADLPVWKAASAAILVAPARSVRIAMQDACIPVESSFEDKRVPRTAWLRALRPHQWTKNLIVLVPLALGWRDVTLASLLTTLVIMGLLCVVASLTYVVNDLADLTSDRRHWSKRRRPFASGAIPVRDGLLAVGILLPIACAATLLVAPLAGVCVLFYVAVTLGYSFGWKRIPLFDTFIIALLFTTRILIGIAAAELTPSAWLLTFSMFFFFSLAMAKRHTEILRAAEHDMKKLEGRGYQAGDESLTLAFGTSAAMASIVIVVIYLVEEVFARQLYGNPGWLWVAPIAIFLFICRIWGLSHRGRMTDDPVAFALRDRVCLGLGVCVSIAIVLAL
ncbi:UbiA family prenyltransferase [Rhodopseudomonas sp. HC1]|uniref:UbiA family prenyltransferase n=1 Tax=Rhodopseudomonas infernalis TaxID=2897386 RepID=UPI001EE963A3|nr:UbiA family prenyltransferase [Rhodopseudomonas infernalis]